MNKLEKYMPPGGNVREMKHLAIIYMLGEAALSIALFLIYTDNAIRKLYDPVTGELLRGVWMEDYRTFWEHGYYKMYWIWLLAFFGYVSDNYRYFLKPAKSIYTMARVRSPWELHIRCWTVPLLTALAMVSERVVLRTVLFILYVLVTPAGVPKPGFGQLIGGLL